MNGFLLLIHHSKLNLESEADRKDKRGDAGDKSREEGVKGECSDHAAVDELHHASEEDVGQVGVDDLELLGRAGAVLLVELGNDSGQGGHYDVLKVLKVFE